MAKRKCRDGLGLADAGVTDGLIDAGAVPNERTARQMTESLVRDMSRYESGARVIADSPFANDTTLERADDVVPRVVAAVVELLTSGQLSPHRLAIRRHLPDRALDQAIKKLEYLRRQ